MFFSYFSMLLLCQEITIFDLENTSEKMVNVSIKDELGPVLCLEGIIFTTTGLISSEISFKLWQFRYNLLYKLNVMYLWNLFLNTKMGYRIVVKWKSEWLLFNAKLAIFQPYHGEYKLHVDEMMSTLY